MLPRNWLLMLIALAAAIALFIMVNGCVSFGRRHHAPMEPNKTSDTLIIISGQQFMFDAGQWWVKQRDHGPKETLPVILRHEVYSAQIIITVITDPETPVAELAWASLEREASGGDTSPVFHDSDGDVDYAYYWRNVGRPGGQLAQERIAFARSLEIPEKTFVFYGAWAEKDEDEMWEQMEKMIVSLRPVPDWYRRTHEGGAR